MYCFGNIHFIAHQIIMGSGVRSGGWNMQASLDNLTPGKNLFYMN